MKQYTEALVHIIYIAIFKGVKTVTSYGLYEAINLL